MPLAAGIRNLRAHSRQSRWTWFGALLGMMVFMATVWFGCWRLAHGAGAYNSYWGDSSNYIAGVIGLFVFCLLQIRVGLRERSPFIVNLGVVFIALDLLAAYLDLFGSMARTGLMFLISGIFLIILGVSLETKRRKLMQLINLKNSQAAP